jgi:tRNA threonylcarbamoyladenosine biosynthesis protein TsaB
MCFILHLETATDICSVAISRKDELLTEKTEAEPYRHTASITRLIEQAFDETGLKPKELSAVSVSQGPGSYTALRVGLSTAKGICFSLALPLIAVDTLKSLALASVLPEDDPGMVYLPMIDARRMEVYAASYNKEGKRLQEVSSVILEPDSFQNWTNNGNALVFCGNGAAKFKEIVNYKTVYFRKAHCAARHLIHTAWEQYEAKQFEDPAYFSPNYVKAPHITTPRKRL